MRSPLSIHAVVLGFALCFVCFAEPMYERASPVITLTEQTFDQRLQPLPKLVLVEFYAPWCSHCVSFRNTYEQVANLIRANSLDMAVAAVDGTKAPELMKRFKIDGYPSFRLFKDGQYVADYRGEREPESLVLFMESHMLPVVLNTTSKEELLKFTKPRAVVAIGHFHQENAGAAVSFHEACDALRRSRSYEFIRCAEVKDSATAAYFKLLSTPVVKVIRKFQGYAGRREPKTVSFDFFSEEGWNTKTLTEFIKRSGFPLLDEALPHGFWIYTRRGLPILWFFVPGYGSPPAYSTGEEYRENSAEQQVQQDEALAVALEVAQHYQGIFSVVWLSGWSYLDQSSRFGVSPPDLPSLGLQNGSQTFAFDKLKYGFSKEGIIQFVSAFQSRKLTPYVKSEPVPESDSGPVKRIVANSIDQRLFGANSDVFVMFYAPWSEPSKEVQPIWESLAKDLQHIPGLVIASMNGAENELPPQVNAFPSFYFKKRSDTARRIDPSMFYVGPHTKAGFLKFIKEHSSVDASTLGQAAEDVQAIEGFLAQFDGMKQRIRQLIRENAALRERLIMLGDDPSQISTTSTQAASRSAKSRNAPHDDL